MYAYRPLRKFVLKQCLTSAVGCKTDYESKGCWSESHSGQELFILYLCFPRVHASSTEPIQMKSSIVFIRGNREKDNIEENCDLVKRQFK